MKQRKEIKSDQPRQNKKIHVTQQGAQTRLAGSVIFEL
jgi:hypothetical protein